MEIKNHPVVTPTRAKIDLGAIRERLSRTPGKQYWRSLEELADTEEFQQFLQAEFPRQAAGFLSAVDRRQFLKLMGASLALAGMSACTRQPTELIVPYVRSPEEIVPGQPLFFATAMTLGGLAQGVLVESHMGRPTKIEGNPNHPASLGATDVFAQASVLTLYDPDRAQVTTHIGEIRPWNAFTADIRPPVEAQREARGAGLRILTETVTSPTLAQQIRDLLAAFPQARWHQYEPAGRANLRAGARQAFGAYVDTQYKVDKADVILTLDSDFLTSGPASVPYAREFAGRRRGENMNRLYAVEVTPSNTGSMADHRLPLRSAAVEDFARAAAAGLGLQVKAGAAIQAHQKWIAALVADLQQHRGSSLIVAGEQQPAAVHALAHAMNRALGNVGKTVVYTDSVEAEPTDQLASLQSLTNDMNAGNVSLLIIFGGNPVYTAPADVPFKDALQKVGLSVYVGLYSDETANLCQWHVPESHYLEAWSDARAFDGTASIVQPLIEPLYESKSAHEVLAAVLGQPDLGGYDIVRAYWQRQHPGPDFETFWRKSVHDGVVAGTALPMRQVTLRSDWDRPTPRPAAKGKQAALDIIFRPDPSVYDGRFANNAWLQELPRPLTRLTWDNAIMIGPATAQRLGLATNDVVELAYSGRTIRGPVWILPGHAADTVSVPLGYGRRRAGNVGNGVGFDAYVLRTSSSMWLASGATLRKTGEHHLLVSTQHHHSMEGRHIVRSGTIAEYRAHPEFAKEMEEIPPRDETLYPPYKYEGHAWGMTIDLSACTGCNACAVACQAENNVSVVGKTEVSRGHEMHWLRVDRYYAGNLDNPEIYHQPVPCMQCELAPCEVVCPVNATNHSSEGLNDMVYNRCVGTKYCSNNCPYKVRRFNWFLYSNYTVDSLKLVMNPDVTVRSRGVMEKCSYCIQRINYARIQSQDEDREIRDGEILTACQQVCPADAIVFGDINQAGSRVKKLKAEPRNYALLGDIDTRPRTTYLARLSNPNPAIGDGEGEA